jgi:hypothetical protein
MLLAMQNTAREGQNEVSKWKLLPVEGKRTRHENARIAMEGV